MVEANKNNYIWTINCMIIKTQNKFRAKNNKYFLSLGINGSEEDRDKLSFSNS